MPNVPPAPDPSPSASATLRPADLAALAVALQETARVLLLGAQAVAPQASQAQASHAAAAPEPGTAPALQAAGPERPGETRAFYFPPAALHMEKELLRRYRARDFQGLLEEAHALLVGLVRLMQSMPKEARVRGYVIVSLGTQLEQACALVLRMRHVYEKVRPLPN